MTEEATPTVRNGRKVREGLVVSDKMQSTVVVAVVEPRPSPPVRQDGPAHHPALRP